MFNSVPAKRDTLPEGGHSQLRSTATQPPLVASACAHAPGAHVPPQDGTVTELANFDDDEGHIVGEGAMPPHSHAVEDCLPHVRQWKLCRIED